MTHWDFLDISEDHGEYMWKKRNLYILGLNEASRLVHYCSAWVKFESHLFLCSRYATILMRSSAKLCPLKVLLSIRDGLGLIDCAMSQGRANAPPNKERTSDCPTSQALSHHSHSSCSCSVSICVHAAGFSVITEQQAGGGGRCVRIDTEKEAGMLLHGSMLVNHI